METLKFKSDEDKKLFELELKAGKDKIYNFIKRRKRISRLLKDRKRSVIQKANWRKYKQKYMQAIRRWHRSVQGKRFHRRLGRYLATRYLKKESIYNNYELAKLISSIKTHYYIEMEYFHPLSVDISLQLLVEELLPLLDSIERKLVTGKDLDDDDCDFIKFVIGLELQDDELNDYIKYYKENKDNIYVLLEDESIENVDDLILIVLNRDKLDARLGDSNE